MTKNLHILCGIFELMAISRQLLNSCHTDHTVLSPWCIPDLELGGWKIGKFWCSSCVGKVWCINTISCRKWISCGWLDKENLPLKSFFFSVFARWLWVVCLKTLLIIDLTEKSKNLGNTPIWNHQQQEIQNLGKSYNEPIGNNILHVKLVLHFLGSGSVS